MRGLRPAHGVRLSTRFAVIVAVLVPVFVLLAGLLVLRLASHDLAAERDRQLTVRLRSLTPLATTYAQRARRNRLITAEVTADRLSTAALGEDAAGGVLVEVPGGPPLVAGAVPTGRPEVPAGALAGPATFADGGTRWRYVTEELGRRGAAGRMWVFEPAARLNARIAMLRRRLLLATLLAVAAGAAAGFGLGRIAGRPLTVLARQARRVDVDPRRHERLTTESGVVEVDELAGLLNRLLDRRDMAVARTAEALETARAFAVTAAHELRTPLTSMGTNLGLLEHPGLAPGERSEIVADLTAEHARLQALITVLRRLAQADLVDPSSFTGVDLAEVADAAVEDARRRHPDAVIEAQPGNGVTVHGWAEGLRMIVDNLLDNAVIHGAAPVTVTTMVTVTAATAIAGGPEPAVPAVPVALLAVEDRGPGVAPELRQAVFDRFHRGPGSPGSGLGLTLIRQLAVLHGGTVVVTGRADGGPGARFEVRLPLGSGSGDRDAFPTETPETSRHSGSWMKRTPRTPPPPSPGGPL